MNRRARPRIARFVLVCVLCITSARTSAAYQVPLTPAALHEAYIWVSEMITPRRIF